MSRSSDLAAASRRIAELQRRYPLPSGWSLAERFLQPASVADLTLFTVGLHARGPAASNAFGSAAERGSYPSERAFFELLERISILDAKRTRRKAFTTRAQSGEQLGSRAREQVFPPDKQPLLRRGSLSNGVALHETWSNACAAARLELIERDRVLRSFRGECRALRVDAAPWLARALRRHYDAQAYEFASGSASPQHRVAGVFLFPRAASAPLAYGFGAASELADALGGAEREALQRLAFLWGEALPEAAPAPAPLPDYHQDYYLVAKHHAVLQAWLGNRSVSKRQEREAAAFDGSPMTFTDLTPAPLRDRLAVAKASSRKALALRFGGREPPHPIV